MREVLPSCWPTRESVGGVQREASNLFVSGREALGPIQHGDAGDCRMTVRGSNLKLNCRQMTSVVRRQRGDCEKG